MTDNSFEFDKVISFARLGIEFETVLKNRESRSLVLEILDIFSSDGSDSIYGGPLVSKTANLNDNRHYLVSAIGAASEMFSNKIAAGKFEPIYSKYGIDLNKLFELFELFNNYGRVIWGLHEERYPGQFWRIENDNTIRGNGVEIVSPKLMPRDFFKIVPAAAQKLIESGLSGDKRCGYHIHISFPFMKFVSCRQTARDIYKKITRMGFSGLAALICLTCNNIRNITQFGDVKRMVSYKSTKTVLSVIKKTLDKLSAENKIKKTAIKFDDLMYAGEIKTKNTIIENIETEILKYKKRFLSGGRNTIIRLFDDNIELRHLGGEPALAALACEKSIYKFMENALAAIPYFQSDEFTFTEKEVYEIIRRFADTEISNLLKPYGAALC